MGLQVEDGLDRTGAEMGRYLVGSPLRAPGQRVGWRDLQGFEEGCGFGGKAVKGRAATG